MGSGKHGQHFNCRRMIGALGVGAAEQRDAADKVRNGQTVRPLQLISVLCGHEATTGRYMLGSKRGLALAEACGRPRKRSSGVSARRGGRSVSRRLDFPASRPGPSCRVKGALLAVSALRFFPRPRHAGAPHQQGKVHGQPTDHEDQAEQDCQHVAARIDVELARLVPRKRCGRK